MPTSKSGSSKRGLGRGFETLIPTDLLDESFDPTVSQDHKVSELRQIKIDQIVVDPDQPRKQFDEPGIQELAESIREHGVLQPIIVTPHKNGYQVVAGERRLHASRIAGLDKIPALVRTLTGQHRLEVSLIENLQRKDLNDMETATAYTKLHSQFNMSLEQIGKRVGNKSIGTISNKMRLLKLPSYVQEMIVNRQVTEGQVRPLIGMEEDIIKKVMAKIIREDLSARKIEQIIVDFKKNRTDTTMSRERQIKEQPYKVQLSRIQKHLKADVSIQTSAKGSGRITIKFKNQDEFERLHNLLG
ncbi:MAG: ParB/RepB/Spo0J family partition protein [Candidatus Saccharibacteria bacterium]|nr:ParB/RepB/Spo0J family partition protein [Candidatus Saccharibacteria bacterium]